MTKKKGFTLIELLIVMGILAILMGAAVVAINPARQFAQARNSQRWIHINSILNAVHQNMIDNKGTFSFTGCTATTLPTSAKTIKIPEGTDGVDLCGCLVPIYLPAMSYDPSTGNYTSCALYGSGYTIYKNSITGRITVAAPSAELTEIISLTR